MKTLDLSKGVQGQYIGSGVIDDIVNRRGRPSLDLALQTFGSFAYIRDIETGDEEYQRYFDLLGASVSRDSRAWYAEWDYSNGGVCGELREYAPNTVRAGPNGPMKETSGATNNVRNARCEEAVAGEALPKHWQVLAAAGLTTTVVENGYKDGWPYVRLALSGTISGTYALGFETSTQIVASDGQERTAQVGIQLVSGSGLLTAMAAIYERTDAGAAVTSGSGHPRTIKTSHRRLFLTRTLSGGSTVARIIPAIQITGSGSVSATVDIFLPMEAQESAPSSPVLPVIGTPAASTRAAETFTGLVTVTRDSRATDAGEWDFTNGGEVSGLREFRPGEARLTGKGLLVEESSTNALRNPRCEGDAGSLPTHWSAAGSTVTLVGRGHENGTPYAEIRFEASGTTVIGVRLESAAYVAASQGQSWTLAAGLRQVGGSLTNIDGIEIRIRERAGGYGSQGRIFVALGDLGSHRRWFISHTIADAGTTHIDPFIYVDTGGAADITLRIYAPQLEQKSYPTSSILPPVGTLGEATREAESIRSGLTGWRAVRKGTLLAEFAPGAKADKGFQHVAGLDLNVNDETSFRTSSSGFLSFIADEGGLVKASLSLKQLVAGETISVAAAWDETEKAATATGAATQEDTTGIVTSDEDGLSIGASYGSSSHLCGYISRITYWPRRRTNADLETLVGN